MRLLPADVPAGLPKWVRVVPPDDVPLNRSSIGAMGLAMGSQMPAKVVKPYVYRGTGEDIFEVEVVAVVEPPKPKKRKARPRKPRWDTRPRLHYRPELPHPPYAPPTYPAPKPEPVRVKWVTRNREPPQPWRPPRPSPGWAPTSGDDIDRMLGELDDD